MTRGQIENFCCDVIAYAIVTIGIVGIGAIVVLATVSSGLVPQHHRVHHEYRLR